MTAAPDSATLEKLLADATPGPWFWQAENECLVGPQQIVMVQDDEGLKSFATYPDGTELHNASLIAAAPQLAAEVLALRAANAELTANLEGAAKAHGALMMERDRLVKAADALDWMTHHHLPLELFREEETQLWVVVDTSKGQVLVSEETATDAMISAYREARK